jgi:hypothetical protein
MPRRIFGRSAVILVEFDGERVIRMKARTAAHGTEVCPRLELAQA